MPYRLVRRRTGDRRRVERLDDDSLLKLARASGIRNPEEFTREGLVDRLVHTREEFLRGELLTIITIALALLLPLTFYNTVHSIKGQDVDRAIRANQVAACKQSLQPHGFRYIDAHRILREAAQNAQIPESFFPSIPPKIFVSLQQREQDSARADARDLLSVNCDALYNVP